jgi:NAD(P)-dependent dehydrogenase (short-subunit alcohol dehydrogenase family)
MGQNQYTFDNPVTRYPAITPPEQHQDGPGTQNEQDPKPDIGADSYEGSGRLEGRKAMVTGADSGIGAAVAVAFAREGADVAISYLASEQEDADRVVALIEAAGRKAVALPGDITDAAFCRRLVESAVDGLGGLDILVNNAGKQQFSEKLTDISDENFDATYKTNVYAMFWITKAALPHLEAGATIINTSSIQGYTPSPILPDYASTKAAINTFSKSLAQQLAPQGIRVNVVAPGPIWTPLQTAGGQPASALPTTGEETALGRWGQPAELAPAYVFLASPESSFVVGETLHVDGGMPNP